MPFLFSFEVLYIGVKPIWFEECAYLSATHSVKPTQ
ncbi:hypothetical protein DFO54_107203 [Erwinia sp. AG740]|nr:hypothetical protein DFO54_107203 [Erwinia sp. AG740]